jgi:hypothetical protein
MSAPTAPIALPGFDIEAIGARLDETGYAVVPGVLSPSEADYVTERLWAASEESQRRGLPAHVEGLDPNAANVRVFDLVDLDPLFGDLLQHPVADAIVARFLGDNYIISNFTANIARPGSGSMFIHSDQSLVAPEPWLDPWAMNIIWCLSDLRADNGATRHVPGSARWTSRRDVPDDMEDRLVAFEAPKGPSWPWRGGYGTPRGRTSPTTRTARCCSATTPNLSYARSGTSASRSGRRCRVDSPR